MHKLHKGHARMPKNFNLEERLNRYAAAIETKPEHFAGHWAQACHPLDDGEAYKKVVLDLGCGKGTFACGMAAMHPDILFIGMDTEPVCIAYAAQNVCEHHLTNAVMVPGMGSDVTKFFGPHELDSIRINFPTPFPKKRLAEYRLTILERLLDYRKILKPSCSLILKTDSQPYFDFTLTQLKLVNYHLDWQTRFTRGKLPDEPVTEYEERLVAQGAHVLGLKATPQDPAPEHPVQTAELSLSKYLPENLDDLGYIPYGMENTVVNLKNYAHKHHENYFKHNR